MALLTPLPLADARRLARCYGLELAAVEALAAGSVNSNFRLLASDGQAFFARIYEEQSVEGARAELGLLRELAAAGTPTTVPLVCAAGVEAAEPEEGELEGDARDAGALEAARADGVLTFRGKPFAVYPWLAGVKLCQAAVTPEHCRLVGEALGRLHAATPTLSSIPVGRFDPADLRTRLDFVETRAPELGREAGAPECAEWVQAARSIRTRLDHYEVRRDASLPSGVTHGDLFRDNVLWVSGAGAPALAALIDFESAARGPLVYDLMITVEAWCYGSEFVPDLVAALFEGYRAVRPLGARERAALLTEGALAALRFATTRLTDFSMRAGPGKVPARDYRRFLARLEALEAGVLDAVR